MKKLLLILALMMLAVSCKTNDEKQIDEYFKNNLKDPSSFVIHKLERYNTGNENDKFYKLDYGAKNGFGAMDRETVVIEFTGDHIYNVQNFQEYELSKINDITSEAERIIDSAAAVSDQFIFDKETK